MKSWPLTDAQQWTLHRGPQKRRNLSADRRRPLANPQRDFALSGRRERRTHVNLAARLQSGGVPSTTVMIANLSNHGARIITRRRCQTREQVVLTEMLGGLHVHAEVIYCQRADGDQYAVGIRFTTPIE
jgi:PilZ domain